MKKTIAVLGILVCCISMFVGCGQKTGALSEKGGIWVVYEKECVKCHRANGRSSLIGRLFLKIPDFTNAKWQDNASDSRLIIAVANGKRKMPAYKGKLTNDEIVELVKVCVRSYYPPAKQ